MIETCSLCKGSGVTPVDHSYGKDILGCCYECSGNGELDYDIPQEASVSDPFSGIKNEKE